MIAEVDWLLCLLSMPCIMLCRRVILQSTLFSSLNVQGQHKQHFSSSRAPTTNAAASMSYLLPHLHTGFAVDQAILSVSVPLIRSERPQLALI